MREKRESFEIFLKSESLNKDKSKFFHLVVFLTNSIHSIHHQLQRIIVREIYIYCVVEERESKKRDDGVSRRRRRDDGTNANAALFEYSSSSFSLDDDDKNGQREERTTKTETGYKIHGLGEFQVLRGGTTRRSVP